MPRLENSPFSRKKLLRSRVLVRVAKLSFLFVVFFLILIFVVFPLLALELPSPERIVRREGFSTKILDRNGKVLYDIYSDQKRILVKIEDVPMYLRMATIAIEDKNFYKHQGFDPHGWLRAIYNIVVKRKLQGGSTLTQQLVKNVLLSPERTLTRKIKEFVLAVQIERKYTKDEILQMYLNEAPYGGTAWGVEAAAETYFGKSVKDLDLVESAFLAGLPQRPSVYSPYSQHRDAYKDRTRQVLRRMREDGYITSEQEEEASRKVDELKFQERGANFKAPHFVAYVQKILEERYGERVVEQGGLKVTTTLDLDLQEKAEEIVSQEIEKVKHLKITNGGAVVLNPETGEILAMVGSRNFNDTEIDGQFNVTLALRQPGSAIKPITYVTAFRKGYTPATLLMDVPIEFPQDVGEPYKPENYDGKFRGPVQVRYALGNSINLPAVEMLAMVGIRDVLEMAYELGVSSLFPSDEMLKRVGLSLTLGGAEVRLLELTSAYAAFMNKGFRVNPYAILKVEDSNGKILEKVDPEKGVKVLSDEEAYLIFDILSDNDARKEVFGANSLLNIQGKTVAVKTGTTNDRRDNWTIGGNKFALVGVWVGNNDFSQMLSVASGVTGASPIWRRILLEALKDKPDYTPEIPEGLVLKEIDLVSGYPKHDGFPSRIEKFIKGTDPTGDDPIHVKLKVCKNQDGLATPSDVAAGNFEEKEFFIFSLSDPVSKDGRNRWQEAIDKWVSEQSDSRYHPPKNYCSTANPVNVEFSEPTDKASNLANTFTVKIKAESIYEIKEVELYVNDEKLRSFVYPPYSDTLNLPDGVYKLTAKAKDENGNVSERVITVGVNLPWDWTPSPTPSPSPSPSPSPTQSPSFP